VTRLGFLSLTALFAIACSSSTPKGAPPRKREPRSDAGPPPTVELDASAPVASPAYRAAKARAQAFAARFVWSKTPTLEQAPTEAATYGGVGTEAFSIAKVELWIKKGELTVRATSGGVERCLGPELVVRGELETKTYDNPLEANKAYFQVPRGGEETDAVRFVETTSYQAPSASVVQIEKLVREADGTPIKATGRFVMVMEGRAPFKPMWAASRFVDAPVTVFAP